jgi:hypothetical protein
MKKSAVQTQVLELYISKMSEKERQAYHIAKSHLTCSFDLSKSIGFLEFAKEREKEREKETEREKKTEREKETER